MQKVKKTTQTLTGMIASANIVGYPAQSAMMPPKKLPRMMPMSLAQKKVELAAPRRSTGAA